MFAAVWKLLTKIVLVCCHTLSLRPAVLLIFMPLLDFFITANLEFHFGTADILR